jgi:serine/threonine-protein kinase
VAIKVLPDAFASDHDRLARFQREAQLLASLNHPNIAAIYGFEHGPTKVGPYEPDGGDSVGAELARPVQAPADVGAGFSRPIHALVLEFVEGPTVADRIERGPIPLDEVLPIARQICDALDAAHEHGIVHRDLKPSNIKIRDDGTVKILDFGLAKLSGAADSGVVGAGFSRPEATHSPTLSVAFTGVGMILGTAAYMAPEQARGKPVDKRADIWAFGCVLFEMLTGTRAFDGTDATEMIAAVVRGEPEWSALPAATPPKLLALLKRCLQKDPKLRVRDIADVRFELDEIHRAPAAPESAAVAPARVPMWRRIMPYAPMLLVTAAIATYAGFAFRPEPSRPLVRFLITLPEGELFSSTGRHAVAISPAGTHIAYSAKERLNLRPLDQMESLPVRGTEGSAIANTAGRSPFFSPDGQWLGFWQNGQLKKVAVSGGAPVALCAADNPFGVSWGADDTIVFGQGAKGIMRVSGAGGTPELVVKVDAGQTAHGPQMLPGGRELLFTLKPEGAGLWDESQIVVQSLDSGERKVLIKGGTDARYLTTGHLVYALQGTLLAVPFDLKALAVKGGPVALVDGVANAGEVTGAAHFSLSMDGTLAYIRGTAVTTAANRKGLAWVDRQGREQPLKAPARFYRYPRISPDGERVALDVQDEQRDIWIWNLRGETLTRLTLSPEMEQYPVWTPDSRRVIFASQRLGAAGYTLFRQAADGTGRLEQLWQNTSAVYPQAVTPDGTRLVATQDGGTTLRDLIMLPISGERQPQPLVQTSFTERNAEISADGRWLAYDSNESGRFEIYVRPFPNINDGRWQVSTTGGTRPLWARNGKELFFLDFTSSTLMSATVATAPVFTVTNVTKLLDYTPYNGVDAGRTYDVAADGRRFLVIKLTAGQTQNAPQSITVVQNWSEELKRRVPSGN